LILTYLVFQSVRKLYSNSSNEFSDNRRLAKLASIVFAVGHISACIWFYIGNQYAVRMSLSSTKMMTLIETVLDMQYWFPGKGISWYSVEENLTVVSFTDHEDKFGMAPGSPVVDKYLLSFYWVAATLTSNG